MSPTLYPIITVIILAFTGLFLYYKLKFSKERKYNKIFINKLEEKINKVINEIESELVSRDKEPYIDILIKKYRIKRVKLDEINPSTKNLIKYEELYKKTDSIYMTLMQNLRLMDNYKVFSNSFKGKKSKYRTLYKRSIKCIEELNIKYKNVDKYLIDFCEYTSIKDNQIKTLNELVKICDQEYNRLNVIIIRDIFKEISTIHCKLEILLNEPLRLKDKFLNSEDNIQQLASEIDSSKGSLYRTILDKIKYSDVSSDDVNRWNYIKQDINKFKKTQILENDIIESNYILSKIIDDLKDLKQDINNEKVTSLI